MYEALKKFTKQQDDLFYNAPEGQAQIDIVKDMATELLNKIENGG